jgi:hypothetical protein
MLKIFRDIYINFIIKTALLFITLFASVLLCISFDLRQSTLIISLLGIFFIAFLSLLVMINSLHKKLNEDIDILSSYLKKIDAKEYDAEIKIKNYLDFLELSLLLKNLVKRLVQKEKKNLKK